MQEFDEPDYEVDPAKDLVETERIEEERAFNLNKIRERKQRVLVASEIAKLAMELNLVDIAFEAGSLTIKD